ncbi:MAG: peptidase M64, partial [Bacteroidales bacterium]|nr:peptidase M64 [Bacteroidales bacterium]
MRIFILLLAVLNINAIAQVDFDRYFINKSLRIDYYQVGDANSSEAVLHKLKKEPFWGGAHTNLVGNAENGRYCIEVFDSLTNTLIYSKGYSTLFYEWQTTDMALKQKECYYESMVVPFPQKSIRLK